MFDRIQNIQGVIGDNNIIINGDICFLHDVERVAEIRK